MTRQYKSGQVYEVIKEGLWFEKGSKIEIVGHCWELDRVTPDYSLVNVNGCDGMTDQKGGVVYATKTLDEFTIPSDSRFSVSGRRFIITEAMNHESEFEEGAKFFEEGTEFIALRTFSMGDLALCAKIEDVDLVREDYGEQEKELDAQDKIHGFMIPWVFGHTYNSAVMFRAYKNLDLIIEKYGNVSKEADEMRDKMDASYDKLTPQEGDLVEKELSNEK